MFHGMAEHKDRYGNVFFFNVRIGGFKSQDAAVKAVVKRNPTGYITDDRDVCLCVIRKGHVVKYYKE